MSQYDLTIIGAGPGGYTGAIRAAQLGLKVAIVEKEKNLGGTCLNVGCIPSKALLDSSEYFYEAQQNFASHGIQCKELSLELFKMMQRKDKIVEDLTKGISFLMKKNKIKHLIGTATIRSASEVEIKTEKTKQTISTKNIMIATGSMPASLPNIQFDGDNIINSTEALSLKKVPKHLLVIGGGAIGLELGSVWKRLGSKVTIVEFANTLCSNMDTELGKELEKILKSQGMSIELGYSVDAVKVSEKEKIQIQASSVSGKKPLSWTASMVLLSVGRTPHTENLGLEAVGIQKDKRGYIEVDTHFQTSLKGVYAVGDVIRGPMLAHKAEEEGVAVAEILNSGTGHVNYNTLPNIIYTWPELASVGKTEEELKKEKIPYNKGKFPFLANGRAKAMGTSQGFVKILAHKESDRVLGVHIIGPRASDMIVEASTAMEFCASSEDIARTFHAHPTLSEVMREAALAVQDRVRQS